MSIRSGAKLKTARPTASVPVSTAAEVGLLDRLSILAGILLSLQQTATSEAGEQTRPAAPAGPDWADTETSATDAASASPSPPIDVARLGENPRADAQTQGASGDARSVAQRSPEQAVDPVLPAVPAGDAVIPVVRLGSSTSPNLLDVDDSSGSDQLSIENLITATPLGDVIVSPIPATTFAFTGAAGPDNFDVFIGTGQGNAVDFSGLTGLQAPAAGAPAIEGVANDTSAPNGVYVNLGAVGQIVTTAAGAATVQAWQLDANGVAITPLAHLENVDNVTGSVGNDIVIGNADANTITYTASDGTGAQSASYGFDIYHGGSSNAAADGQDTADFSALGSQESVAAALAEGVDLVLLPDAATGITVDLAEAVTVTTVNPETGDLMTVSGSVVSTIGGTEQTDLALLAWAASADGGEESSTIENIVSSGGADAIWGNDADNTVVVTGSGESGALYFDGRGGSDTVDFSQLPLSGSDAGIEIHLNQVHDALITATGEIEADLVQISVLSSNGDDDDGDRTRIADVKDVENVVGSRGNDVIEGDCNDNILTGGGGSDSFVFGDMALVDGRGVTQVGHDIIRDFRRGGIDDDDHLVFDSRIFNFQSGNSLDWLQQLLTNNQIRDEDEGLIIWIDENNTITLQNYELDDYSGPGLGLGAYESWIVFV
jgi:hypothetical protein